MPQDIQQHSVKLMQISIIVNVTFFFPAVFMVIKTGIFSLKMMMFHSYQLGFVPKTDAKLQHRET